MIKEILVSTLLVLGLTLAGTPGIAYAADSPVGEECVNFFDADAWDPKCIRQWVDDILNADTADILEIIYAVFHIINNSSESNLTLDSVQVDSSDYENRETYCRSIYGTPEWLRRCQPQQPPDQDR